MYGTLVAQQLAHEFCNIEVLKKYHQDLSTCRAIFECLTLFWLNFARLDTISYSNPYYDHAKMKNKQSSVLVAEKTFHAPTEFDENWQRRGLVPPSCVFGLSSMVKLSASFE